MGHLAAPRIGWENEHLAAFLLSRISFVANPVTVADDIGTDFFCTLFESRTENNAEQLFPRNSFAIQIKSKEETIPATNKIQYLSKLELPFFVGVVDRDHLLLRIFSGEYLPILFTQHGVPQEELRLSPVLSTDIERYCEVTTGQNLEPLRAFLKLPFVMEICAQESRTDVLVKAQRLSELCARMHDNISARASQEYIFKLDQPGAALIMAGSGSITTFRRNFCWRLAEAFYNLEWLYNKQRGDFRIEEFRIYEKCYLDLLGSGTEIPPMLKKIYGQLKQQWSNKLGSENILSEGP